MTCLAVVGLWLAWVAVSGLAFADEDPQTLPRKVFHSLDTDGNQTLSLDEYLKRPGLPAANTRDFRVFDFDESGSLDFDEFSAIPGLTPAWQRGAFPDPYEEIADLAMESVNKLVGWDKNPALVLDTYQFLRIYLSSLGMGDDGFTGNLYQDSDQNQNGQVDRAEARRMIEIHLGMRTANGVRLRETGGREIATSYYLFIDTNRNNQIERAEFLDRWWDKEHGGETFDKGDLNHDGVLTYEEMRDPHWASWEDQIEWFLNGDKDFNGKLSPAELSAATPDYNQPQSKLSFPAFDADGDGELTLSEHLLSPLGHRVLPWESVLTDHGRDHKISLSEFRYDQGQMPLLRWFFFNRFDRNRDGSLTPDEFAFKVLKPNAIYRLWLDPPRAELIFQDESYPNCGSPAVSPDGTQILFDGYAGGKGLDESQILLMTTAGQGLRSLGKGLMPTWSPDGQKLVCSQYGEQSVSIRSLDGMELKTFPNGWGPQWSPDGELIAYINQQDQTLMVYEVSTEKTRVVLGRDKHSYQYLYYNVTWSPDSQRIAFKGVKQQGAELASVDARGPQLKARIHLDTSTNFDNDVAWSPDGHELVVALSDATAGKLRLHRLSAQGKADPVLLPGQEFEGNANNCTFAPDGKSIFVVVGP